LLQLRKINFDTTDILGGLHLWRFLAATGEADQPE
jgi:hypothetical protein